MIQLKEIDRNNLDDVIHLSVSEKQKGFVASNLYSIAQAKAQPECIPMAVYNNEELVGFVMYCMDCDDNEYWIYRVMIDEKYQGKGYGTKAVKEVINIIQRDKEYHKVYISFEPENELAKRVYEKIGFKADGRFIGGEVVYCLNY